MGQKELLIFLKVNDNLFLTGSVRIIIVMIEELAQKLNSNLITVYHHW